MTQFLPQQIDASTIRMLIFVGGIIIFLIIELIVPYRVSSVSKVKRWLNNLSLVFFNSIILHLIFSTTIIATAHYVSDNKLGAMNLEYMSGLPHWLRILIILVFLDFILYIWHVLNHFDAIILAIPQSAS